MWKQELADVSHIKVHRWLLHGLSSVDKVELHGFGDASQRAYGSAVYLCAEDREGKRVSNLVMVKSKVAPVTLPRLELLAAFITTKLLYYSVHQGSSPNNDRCSLRLVRQSDCAYMDKRTQFQVESFRSKQSSRYIYTFLFKHIVLHVCPKS